MVLTLGETVIRKVRALGDRARKQAEAQGLSDDDIVIVNTIIDGGLPNYKITKIEGSPTDFLDRYYLGRKS